MRADGAVRAPPPLLKQPDRFTFSHSHAFAIGGDDGCLRCVFYPTTTRGEPTIADLAAAAGGAGWQTMAWHWATMPIAISADGANVAVMDALGVVRVKRTMWERTRALVPKTTTTTACDEEPPPYAYRERSASAPFRDGWWVVAAAIGGARRLQPMPAPLDAHLWCVSQRGKYAGGYTTRGVRVASRLITESCVYALAPAGDRIALYDPWAPVDAGMSVETPRGDGWRMRVSALAASGSTVALVGIIDDDAASELCVATRLCDVETLCWSPIVAYRCHPPYAPHHVPAPSDEWRVSIVRAACDDSQRRRRRLVPIRAVSFRDVTLFQGGAASIGDADSDARIMRLVALVDSPSPRMVIIERRRLPPPPPSSCTTGDGNVAAPEWRVACELVERSDRQRYQGTWIVPCCDASVVTITPPPPPPDGILLHRTLALVKRARLIGDALYDGDRAIVEVADDAGAAYLLYRHKRSLGALLNRDRWLWRMTRIHAERRASPPPCWLFNAIDAFDSVAARITVDVAAQPCSRRRIASIEIIGTPLVFWFSPPPPPPT